MEIEVKIIKGIPKEQIDEFEDKVVYNTAVATREFTKSRMNYPYLTGKLMRSEVAAPIVGSNKSYGLTTGVDYAIDVWGMTNVNWTNPNTQPQWYYRNFQQKGYGFLTEAVIKAKKGL